jgi:hypothetical protein
VHIGIAAEHDKGDEVIISLKGGSEEVRQKVEEIANVDGSRGEARLRPI